MTATIARAAALGSRIYAPPRYRYDVDEERTRRLPDPGCEFCTACGDERAEDELEDGLCEGCR